MIENSVEHEKFAKWLFAQETKFVAGAAVPEMIPDLKLPEIAIIGKSNVGKSSLVNSLTGRKTLARVSHTPGRTRQLNFFSVADKLTLVDLPGYGYAKVSKKMLDEWDRLIHDYLRGRKQLVRAYVLIDSRRGLKDDDRGVMELLDDMAVSYHLVLTKTDKCKKEEVNQVLENVKSVATKFTALHPEMFVTSSRDNIGIKELKEAMAKLAS